jgi:hypothetical protein
MTEQSTFEIPASRVLERAEFMMSEIKRWRAEKFATFCDKFRADNTKPVRFFGLLKAKTCTRTNDEILATIKANSDNWEYAFMEIECGLFSWSKDLAFARNMLEASIEALKVGTEYSKMRISVADNARLLPYPHKE